MEGFLTAGYSSSGDSYLYAFLYLYVGWRGKCAFPASHRVPLYLKSDTPTCFDETGWWFDSYNISYWFFLLKKNYAYYGPQKLKASEYDMQASSYPTQSALHTHIYSHATCKSDGLFQVT